jgi:ubiquinone/menaquinone biosynthesis C-methylase UbiE
VNGRRTHRHEKLARLYDDEILPVWAERFGRMILRGLPIPPRSTLLDVSCGTGYPALDIARRMDDGSRLVAIDASSALLDVARKKAALMPGKKIFFRTQRAFPKLPFTADVFDVVFSNLGLLDPASPSRALRDFARVAKPEGGRVLATLPLAGSWQEFHDLYREVLVKHDQLAMIERLDKLVASMPDAATCEGWLAAAGLEDARVDVEEFTLLFRSSREFFFAPVVEFGPLPEWKSIAGRGAELQDTFWHIKEAIDAYFGNRAFQITIVAGCLSGVKQQPWAGADLTGPLARADESADDGEPLSTEEVELIEEEGHLAAEELLERPDEELDAFRGGDDGPDDEGTR